MEPAAAAADCKEEKMMKEPGIYAEWTKLFQAFRQHDHDEEVLSAMRQGSLVWQTGVAGRFVRRLLELTNARMDDALSRCQQELRRVHSESELIRALLNLRRELNLAWQLTQLPVIPEEARGKFAGLVRKQADKIQACLEESGGCKCSGRIQSLARNHKVNIF